MRKAIDLVYAAYLPKGSHPFVYMSLQIAPSHVDVNVHPTKHEVHFLNQDEIIEKIQRALDAKLMGSNASRTFKTQTLLPGAPVPEPLAQDLPKEAPKNLVRTDAKEQKLDKFLSFSKPSNDETPKKEIKRRQVKLASVQRMRQRLQDRGHPGLRDLMANHAFVGCIDRQFSLLQHNTKLYVANNAELTDHFFYQIALEDFANFEAYRLSPAPSVRELALLALDMEEAGWTEADGDKAELADFMVQMLTSKAPMLDDYFSIDIDAEGRLGTLPLLLADYVPFFNKIPLFMMRLATEVDWDAEEDCLDGICREVARLYAMSTDPDSFYDADQHDDDRDQDNAAKRWQNVVEHVLYPAMKRRFHPLDIAADDMTFVQVANLPDLYKVFERC